MNPIIFYGARLSALLAVSIGTAWADAASQSTNSIDVVPRLTADTLVAWVLDANPGLSASEAVVDAAVHRIDLVGSLDDPMLSYSLAPRTIDSDQGRNERIDVSQKFPWPGTLAARTAAARYDTNALEQDVMALRLRLAEQAKSAFAEWQFVDSALAIHHTTLTLLDELISVAQSRYAVGRALKQDVLQAEVERAALDQRLLKLLREKTTVQARINALLNRAPDAFLPPARSVTLTPTPNALTKTVGSTAWIKHPELARIEAQINAAESRETVAEKAFYPDIQLGVGYNSLWDEADKRTTVSVSVSLPLDRGKRRSELSRARADTRRIEWLLAERRANLQADIAEAMAEVIEIESSVRLYQDQLVPLAAEYLDAALADYQSGTGAFLNVISAEQRKLNTDLALARALADYTRRLASLERWIGDPLELDAIPPVGAQP